MPKIKQKIIDMASNGSGVRVAARVLVSVHRRSSRLKKEPDLQQVNEEVLKKLNTSDVCSVLQKVEAEEVDEIRSFIAKERTTNAGCGMRWIILLAYAFGRREDEAFRELKAVLAPFGITRCCTDGWGAYTRHLDED